MFGSLRLIPRYSTFRSIHCCSMSKRTFNSDSRDMSSTRTPTPLGHCHDNKPVDYICSIDAELLHAGQAEYNVFDEIRVGKNLNFDSPDNPPEVILDVTVEQELQSPEIVQLDVVAAKKPKRKAPSRGMESKSIPVVVDVDNESTASTSDADVLVISDSPPLIEAPLVESLPAVQSQPPSFWYQPGFSGYDMTRPVMSTTMIQNELYGWNYNFSNFNTGLFGTGVPGVHVQQQTRQLSSTRFYAPPPPSSILPLHREWIKVDRSSPGRSTTKGRESRFTLTIVSYNILCQRTVGQTAYLYDRANCIVHDWRRRWAGLQAEFRKLDADIFCLQEVEEWHYLNEISPFFKDLGYDSVFKKRTSGRMVDGCATFFKRSRFSLITNVPVEYECPGTFIDRQNVALITVFRPVSITKPHHDCFLVVANTHLLFNPKRGDIKLAQLAILMSRLESVAFKTAGSYHPILLCGDLNTQPNSPCYKFIFDGQVKYDGQLSADIAGQGKVGGRLIGGSLLPEQLGITDDCENVALIGNRAGCNSRRPRKTESEKLPFSTGVLMHPFELASVYDHRTKNDESEVSTFHRNGDTMVDYIFYGVTAKNVLNDAISVEEDRIRLIEKLSLPSRRELENTVGLMPNVCCPSDHLSLAVKMDLIL